MANMTNNTGITECGKEEVSQPADAVNSTTDHSNCSSVIPNTSNATTEPAAVINICSQFNVVGTNCEVLIYCKRVSASLSIAGCLFAIALLLFYKRNLQFTQRLILNLMLAALLEAISFFLVDIPEPSTPFCNIQAPWLLFCLWAVLLWILFITINILMKIIWSKTLKRYELFLTFCCWCIPVIIACIPKLAGVYGPEGPWCWFHKDMVYWKIGLWYFWAVLAFIVVCALVAAKKCRKGTNALETSLYSYFTRHESELIQDVHILRAHHAIYFIMVLVLFPLVNDVYFHMNKEYIISLLLLQTLSLPFIGGAITVSFALDKSTRYVLHPKVIAEVLRRRFKVFEELWKPDRSQSCDTFLIDIFVSSTSGEMSRDSSSRDSGSRDSGFSSFHDKRSTGESLAVIIEEIKKKKSKHESSSTSTNETDDMPKHNEETMDDNIDSDEGIFEMFQENYSLKDKTHYTMKPSIHTDGNNEITEHDLNTTHAYKSEDADDEENIHRIKVVGYNWFVEEKENNEQGMDESTC